MTKIKELQLEIAAGDYSVTRLRLALADEIAKPENNVFDSLKDASDKLNDRLLNKAHSDCESWLGQGNEEYRQKFIVDNKIYTCVLKVEYSTSLARPYYVNGFGFFILDANEKRVKL